MGNAGIMYRVSYGVGHGFNAFLPRLNLKRFRRDPHAYFFKVQLRNVNR